MLSKNDFDGNTPKGVTDSKNEEKAIADQDFTVFKAAGQLVGIIGNGQREGVLQAGARGDGKVRRGGEEAVGDGHFLGLGMAVARLSFQLDVETGNGFERVVGDFDVELGFAVGQDDARYGLDGEGNLPLGVFHQVGCAGGGERQGAQVRHWFADQKQRAKHERVGHFLPLVGANRFGNLFQQH